MYLLKNTTLILQQLRLLMVSLEIVNEPLSAYIVPSGDAHHSIRMAQCDQRRAFVSGFDGSAGTVVITQDSALLWTDARYFIQAEAQLDENWTLMKEGISETQSKWLASNLGPGSKVGIDPRFYSKLDWDALENELNSTEITLVGLQTNLVDEVWTDRPSCPLGPVKLHELEYAGVSVRDKVNQVRQEMAAVGAEVLFLSELDEVAWILNLRGTDLPLAPVFSAYVLLTSTYVKIYIDFNKISDSIQQSLIDELDAVIFFPYDRTFEDFSTYASTIKGNIWISKYCNALFANVIRPENLIMALTPVSLMKAIKNPVEVTGMQRAHLRDSVVLGQFLHWLEDQMSSGDAVISEISAADKLLEIRQQQENFVSLSFPTISGTGPNGAIVHYWPTPETDRNLAIDEMYLLDSGSHYLDGTTDITRTMHFGTPSAHQKDAFTRVLKGHIAIALAIFPNKTVGNSLDALARQFLWEAGYDYGHGTSHGIGAYLNVGEGPQSIGNKYNPDDSGLRANMFLSNEPGYYEEDAFGIRLENIVQVVDSHLVPGFLQMQTISFVPFQQKLIDVGILSAKEIDWIDEYHRQCLELVEPYLNGADLEWLRNQTLPLALPSLRH